MSRPASVALVVALVAACAGLAASSCSTNRVPTPPPPDPPPDSTQTAWVPPPPPSKPKVESTLDAQGLSLAALDRSADPCQDFYQFACGGWEKTTEIPEDRSRWSRSFSEIDQRNEADLKAILDAASKKGGGKKGEKPADKPADKPASPPNSALGRVGRFYAACMNTAAVDKAGVKPLRPLLEVVNRVKDEKSLTKALVELHKHGLWALFDIESGQDYKDATRMIGVLDQNGLGLPDRDYYLKLEDPDKKAIREKYVAHVEKMLALSGMDAEAAKAATEHVMRIETAIAKASKSREERRDPNGMYNKIDRAGVEKAAPSIDWAAYFKGLGSGDIKDINVTSPKFFESLEELLKAEKPEAMRAYLTWQVVHRAAGRLSKPIEDEDFAMQQILTGQKQQRERWKRCIDATDEALGELLAQPFIDLRFGPESKQGAEKLIAGIRAAMNTRLDELAWMDQPTRDKAKDKLSAMAFLIGYPEKWKKYDFELTDVYFPNSLAAAAFKVKDNLGKIGKPVDRGEWKMTPPTVNAYYDSHKNQMVFPAGILQPPFYNPKASDVVNLGAMGMVVGHELTHGFDDKGSQFDKAGNLANWWSEKTGGVFKQNAGCVEKQYGAYEVLPGLTLNGKLTLGENIADAGGVKLAYRAYRSLRDPVKEETIADGFTEDQQFFLSIGQIWCTKAREQTVRLLVQTDSHSHPRYRVNGPLSHLGEFARAFKCAAGTKMVAKEACAVW